MVKAGVAQFPLYEACFSTLLPNFIDDVVQDVVANAVRMCPSYADALEAFDARFTLSRKDPWKGDARCEGDGAALYPGARANRFRRNRPLAADGETQWLSGERPKCAYHRAKSS